MPAAAEGADEELLAVCRAMPKVDLHAHLSGSIPDHVLAGFLAEDVGAGRLDGKVDPSSLTLLSPDAERSLSQCFEVFSLIHHLVSTPQRLCAATRSVLEAYEADNCVYLELRTTPRACEHMSARQYVHCVLDTIASWRGRMTCRLILSLNRAAPLDDAVSTVDVARGLLALPESHRFHGLLVGVELSGNPARSRFSLFVPLLQSVRSEFGTRLPISLHFAELPDDDEADAMLQFRPERLGHAVAMSGKSLDQLLDSRICVEVCLTSNLVTRSVAALEEHPVVRMFPAHPFCVCTDDAGVFRTSLTREYYLLASIAPGVRLGDVTARAVAFSFASEKTKRDLRALLRAHAEG
jgi:adenosine deaminase